MPEPGDYAEAIVIARAIKARLLRPEVIREAALAADFGEALSSLRDSIYSGLGEARGLAQAYSSVWSSYFRQLKRLAQASPAPASELLMALQREEELRDVMILLQSVLLEKRPDVKLPSLFAEGSIVRALLEDPEALLSPQKFSEAVSGSFAAPYVGKAIKAFKELKGGPVALWATPLATLSLYSNSLLTLGGDREDAERIICLLLEEKALSSLLLAKSLNVPQRFLEEFMDWELCGLAGEELLELYAAEAEALGIAAELRGRLSVRAEGKSVQEVLSSARRSARSLVRARALATMAGYPFRVSFLLSPLLLLRLEAEDVLLLLASKEYKIPPDYVLPQLAEA
ncbi:MAG: V-type ATPase subunit [Acidilobaceae archaeon]|nr:V-type ATPase subunit [Acidilobaceae archaeon]